MVRRKKGQSRDETLKKRYYKYLQELLLQHKIFFAK